MLVASTARRHGALLFLSAALAACSGSEEAAEVEPVETVEVPTGEVGPAPPVPGGPLSDGADSGAVAFPDSTAAGH